jgi:predicted nuclease with TOPRIM domain
LKPDTNVPIRTIQAFLKGKKVRKDIAYLHRKEKCLKESRERVQKNKASTKALENRILELEKENAELKSVVATKTPGFLEKVKSEMEELLHIRQIHHMRKTKLISH